MQSFATTLKEHRKRLGLTQARMAALFPPNLPLRTWQKWEGNHRVPPEWEQRLILRTLEATKPA